MMRKKLLSAIIAVILLAVLMGTSSAASSDSEKSNRARTHEEPDKESNKKRVIIIYNRDVAEEDADDLEKKGAKVKHIYRIIPGIAAEIDEEDLDAIKSDKDIETIFEDTRVYAFLQQSVPQIHADQVHSLGETGLEVKVCIVDSGVDDSHPALNPLVAEYDFVNKDIDATDDEGHGTHVAGIVASIDSVYRGVAPDASLMAAKVLDAAGSGWTSDVVAGIDWCVTNGADIINLSLGGSAFPKACDSEPSAQAANNAADAGVVVFAATGNDGNLRRISSPACGSKVIAVGAVDDLDGKTPYSNEGTELDIVAPGGSAADGIISAQLGGGFVGAYGTSMATPHAAGTGALLLGKNPALTPIQVRSILINTALDLGNAGFDTIYGYGRIDALSAYQAVPPPKIIFVSTRYGNDDIFSMNSDGTSPTRLTSAPEDDFLPDIYTDKTAFNSKITFASRRDGNPEIYIMNLDGSGQTRLTWSSALDFRPVFSPDGTKIVFDSNRDGNFEIYIINSDGSKETRLTSSAGDDFGARFSPDGTKIVFTSFRDGNKSEIYLMNINGTNQVRLTNNTAHDLRPVFSPDGSKIVFDSNRSGIYNIYLMNNDGTGQEQLTVSAIDAKQPMFFNRNNKLIYYTYNSASGGANSEIYTVDIINRNIVQITNNSAIDYYPFAAFDDSKIFFVSNRDGNYEIYSSNPDSSSQVNLTNNNGSDLWIDIGS